MYERNIEHKIREALTDTPVILINGARQTGKSTLAGKIAGETGAQYITLDDATALSAAVSDPTGFIKGFKSPIVIDEVQKAPSLFPAIKIQVDSDRRPGQFLLTGSANVLMLPKLSESLAGRMEIHTLWPLSQGELLNHRERFIESLYSKDIQTISAPGFDLSDLIPRLVSGGYPEAVRRKRESRVAAWFGSYITTILQRDVRDLANIEGLTEMPRLLSLISARVCGLLNMSELSRSAGIPHTTLKRYLTLLETTFLLQTIPAWSSHLGKRLIKSPKINLVDSGLTAFLAGFTSNRLKENPTFMGHLFEGFVLSELQKQITWSDIPLKLFHLRTTGGAEVDVVLEDTKGQLVGIEVKASATLGKNDFRGLKVLEEMAGPRFLRGVVLYCGDKMIPFGSKLIASPISALWSM